MRAVIALLTIAALGGCTATAGPIMSGPAPEAIVNPYEAAKQCLVAQMEAADMDPVWMAVGDIKDMTGKASFDEGTGYFIPQGPNHLMQAALSQTGMFGIVERVDMTVAEAETALARDRLLGDGTKYMVPDSEGNMTEVDYLPLRAGSVRASDFYIAGAVTHLDLDIFSAGGDVRIGGIGPRYRQFRALVGFDVRVIDTDTRREVASRSYYKQIVGDAAGFGISRIFGTVLVGGDIGYERTESIGLAIRWLSMLSALELAADVYGLEAGTCLKPIDDMEAEMRSMSSEGLEKEVEAET